MKKTLAFVVAGAMLLAACAPAATPVPEQVSAPTEAPTQVVAQAEPTQPLPPTAEPPGATPTDAPTAEPQPTAAMIKDTRQAVDVFKVSDPATVSLAAGVPQFVEFFAFW
jgi:PBP1b-binding outer membrane lipoprotein LpoB